MEGGVSCHVSPEGCAGLFHSMGAAHRAQRRKDPHPEGISPARSPGQGHCPVANRPVNTARPGDRPRDTPGRETGPGTRPAGRPAPGYRSAGRSARGHCPAGRPVMGYHSAGRSAREHCPVANRHGGTRRRGAGRHPGSRRRGSGGLTRSGFPGVPRIPPEGRNHGKLGESQWKGQIWEFMIKPPIIKIPE